MVSKPSDLFSRLPSVNDLLEKPPVRVLVDRWNRSAVADGVRSFLAELRSDIERRAADFQMPSLREIAERAARHVAAQRQSAERPVVNATGRFFGPECRALPLADVALERMISVSRGFLSEPGGPSSAVAQLCQLTGAESAIVVSSYSGAVSLALATLAAEREVVVARCDLGELADGSSLVRLAPVSGVCLREVGAVNRAAASDYEHAITERTVAIVHHRSEKYRVEGDVERVEFAALASLARDRQLSLVELLGSAPLGGNLPSLSFVTDNAAARITAGAHLVVLRGDGLLGGPRCGILLGTRKIIERIAAHPLAAAWSADPVTLVALEATLALYDDHQQLSFSLPLFQLLTTSIENLRQRAERLAPQLAVASDIASAAAVECEARLGLDNLPDDRLSAWAMALTPTDGNVAALDQRLRSAPVPIVAARQDDRLFVNLRTVLPRQDQTIVDMVAGVAPAVAENPGETAATAGA